MRLPRKLSATTPQAVEFNLMVDWIAKLRPIPGPGDVSSNTPFGTVRTQLAKPAGGPGASTKNNWNYRGYWVASPASAYMTYDVVQYGTGTSSGMYLSTINSNANLPDSGIGWVQVSSSSGTWL